MSSNFHHVAFILLIPILMLSLFPRIQRYCNVSSPLFRFLYFEYNEIHAVDPGTLDSMPSLQLLFLNANLLRSLPLGVFSGVNLARLNLRNNHLLHLPMEGVLEHLTGLVQVGANLRPHLIWMVEGVHGAGGGCLNKLFWAANMVCKWVRFLALSFQLAQ